MKPKERGGTKTSSFGVSKRESHDSSDFYSRKLYESRREDASTGQENPIDESLLDTVQCVDSRDISSQMRASISWSPRPRTTWGRTTILT